MSTTSISFFVRGEPQGQPRTKASSRNGFVRCYTPLTVKGSDGKRRVHPAVTWKNQIALAWKLAKPDTFQPITGPVKLTLDFIMPRPKAHFRANGDLKPTAPHWCENKPDWDNLEKCISDKLTELSAWYDDKQVAYSITSKTYVRSLDSAGCVVIIERLT